MKIERFSNMTGFQTSGPQEVQKLEQFGLTVESTHGEVLWFLGNFSPPLMPIILTKRMDSTGHSNLLVGEAC